jgi:methylmalonyl-CoA mutase N-terminal domain/subunit
LKIDPRLEHERTAEVKRARTERDQPAAAAALDGLRTAAQGTENLLPRLLACVRAFATVGEMADVLRQVFGEHSESRA